MTDAFQPNVDEFTDFVQKRQDEAVRRAMPTDETDPDKAARAAELSDYVPIHPAIIRGNLDNVESQFRNQLTNTLIQRNQHLQDYVNSHPLAAELSSDDWGNLDTTSQAVQKLGTKSILETGLDAFKTSMEQKGQVLRAAGQGFAQGMGPAGPGSWMLQHPEEGYKEVEDKPEWQKGIFAGLALVGSPLELGFRAFNGMLQGGIEGFKETLRQGGMSDDQAEKLGNETSMAIQFALLHGGGALGTPHVPAELTAS